MSDDRLLTIPQAADLLGKSETYVRDRIKNKTFAAMEVGQGTKRRWFKVAESKMLEHKKILDAKEKDRASRRRRPKVEKVEACLPAVQGDMFVGIGIKEALENLLAEAKKQTTLLESIDAGQGIYESMNMRLQNIETDIQLIRQRG